MGKNQPHNAFLFEPMGRLYARTALPIIFVMSVNGALAVTDALFLGWYVGSEGLAAVTLMFPVTMALIACASLVSTGMSSVLARHLGAGRQVQAEQVFAGAHGLALVMSAALMAAFFAFGETLVSSAAGGSATLIEMGYSYVSITIMACPLSLLLSVHSDALRNEGRAGLMALISLFVSLANIVLNYGFIAILDWGVAGSALGTAAAQTLAFAVVLTLRSQRSFRLRMGSLLRHGLGYSWLEIIALGAPQSLSYLGLSLGSMTIIVMLQVVDVAAYDSTVAAYGIVTRVMTFVFLPLLGLSMAMQTITGNNFGSENWDRSDLSLKVAIGTAAIYCAIAQAVLTLFPSDIGNFFVADNSVLAELSRIVPIMVSLYCVSGPLLMIATHFQAIGEAKRAAILSLSRTYLFAIPLTLILPQYVGENGIWLASPLAEIGALSLTAFVLTQLARTGTKRMGLFDSLAKA